MTYARRSYNEVIDNVKKVETLKLDGQVRVLSKRAKKSEIFKAPMFEDTVDLNSRPSQFSHSCIPLLKIILEFL